MHGRTRRRKGGEGRAAVGMNEIAIFDRAVLTEVFG